MSGEAGTPAPFSSDQVAALGRGKLAEDEVAAVLDSHPSATAGGAAAAGAAGQAAPLELSPSDLEALARGETPPRWPGGWTRPRRPRPGRRRRRRRARPSGPA